jgi:hypothetical protein
MAKSDRDAPAIFRRAFFILTTMAVGVSAATPPVQPPELAQIGKPDAAEAQRLLTQFRESGIAGEYYLEFDLIELPRRGDEKHFQGRLWGGRNEQGAIERISLRDAGGNEHRLLVQNGPNATGWRLVSGQVQPLGVTAILDPVIPGVELSAFDLQMPFLYWPGATVESIRRTYNRPSYQFVFPPPATFATAHPELSAVRSYFDTQFNAPMQTELLGRDGRATKTLTLLDLKKVNGQYIPKSFEVRDEVSRNKTRLVVTGAALDVRLPASVFAPAELAGEAASLPVEAIAP